MIPSTDQQNAYYYLRSCVTAAVAEDFAHARPSAITTRAVEDLRRFTAYHPKTDFRIFRPEDLDCTDKAGSKLFLR